MSEQRIIDSRPWGVFLVFLRLGLTSFGGPVAHLGYFRDEIVIRRRWLSEQGYGDLVAMCQFLPGPASSQVGIALGLCRAGYAGAIAAWVGFTAPSAIAMILLAKGLTFYGETIPAAALHGLKVAAVAVVAQALWGMARNLCPDASRISLMVLVACFTVLVSSIYAQLLSMALAAVFGMLLFTSTLPTSREPLPLTLPRSAGAFWLSLFVLMLAGLPILAATYPSHTLSLLAAFFRVGSLVFGGGHVVLPLLQTEVVPTGWVANDVFLAGYGAVQAMPGPLFTFAAFLGASISEAPSGWSGGLLCLAAIFAPSFLLVMGALPFWESLRQNRRMQAALMGVNAAVVGLLLAAFYQPVWTSAILAPQDFALALMALLALMRWQLPPWLVVLGCGGAGWLATAV
ncbi:chromate efflux transporter [Pseudomonas sp. NFR16]|uniref:chromate efflux transporter n=1 Tax=Pseudomonas sp. NFR16 TaxID=1566248 RepID=UPI0008ACDA29|nr:chromate efflux transporter [Pseudomonas sp. NFR16]SEI42629.1 chromate transporter [Pseudomonas sp. NFR16]